MTMLPSGGLVAPGFTPIVTSTPSINDEVAPGLVESSADSSSKSIVDILRERALNDDSASMDYLISYLLSEQSAQTARDWTAKREDSQYQRFVRDAKAAGINPYFALSGGSPVSSSTQGINYQGSSYTSARNNKRTNTTSTQNNWRNNIFDLIGDVLGLMGNVVNSASKVTAAGIMAG